MFAESAAAEEGHMPKGARPGPSLLSGLPGDLATDLFVGAKPVRLAADEVFFLPVIPATVAIASMTGCSR